MEEKRIEVTENEELLNEEVNIYDFMHLRNTANGNSYCNTNLSSNEYRVLWESGRIFISIFLYEHICICTSVNTGYIIYLPNKRAEEKINH